MSGAPLVVGSITSLGTIPDRPLWRVTPGDLLDAMGRLDRVERKLDELLKPPSIASVAHGSGVSISHWGIFDI